MDIVKKVVIVDYGLGNLHSVKQSCGYVGINAIITYDKEKILKSDAIILPGVGAFGDAMDELKKRDLIDLLRDEAKSGKILIGICLGMQLLMSESIEFGIHKGLDIIPGTTHKFSNTSYNFLKVPQIGWNHINSVCDKNIQWEGTLLHGLSLDEYMYFIHSFYVKPTNSDVIIAYTDYGNITYCSALQYKNIIGFQFHPERSGPSGLKIYKNLARCLNGEYRLN